MEENDMNNLDGLWIVVAKRMGRLLSKSTQCTDDVVNEVHASERRCLKWNQKSCVMLLWKQPSLLSTPNEQTASHMQAISQRNGGHFDG